MPTHSFRFLLVVVSIFSIAMGYMESAIVVYLRELYYPGMELFPLQKIDMHIAITEVFRELATMIMLLGVGWMVGRNASERLAWFLFSFAVWDIFYYVFLKVLIDWPSSLLTWDILFLIPVTWVGPVITPVILSSIMVLFSLLILHYNRKLDRVRVHAREWTLLLAGSAICIVSFTLDYCRFVTSKGALSDIWSLSFDGDLFDLTYEYVPQSFDWWIFWLGTAVILGGVGLFWKRQRVSCKRVAA